MLGMATLLYREHGVPSDPVTYSHIVLYKNLGRRHFCDFSPKIVIAFTHIRQVYSFRFESLLVAEAPRLFTASINIFSRSCHLRLLSTGRKSQKSARKEKMVSIYWKDIEKLEKRWSVLNEALLTRWKPSLLSFDSGFYSLIVYYHMVKELALHDSIIISVWKCRKVKSNQEDLTKH